MHRRRTGHRPGPRGSVGGSSSATPATPCSSNLSERDVRATTTNGPLSLKELGGDVRARTTNGPLGIVLNGRMWEGQGLDAETQNGPLRMAVPDGYSAQIETGTVNGPFSIDIPVTVQGLVSRRSVKGTIGGGGAPIRAVTHNGPVSIDKR